MYVPEFYAEEDLATLHEFMRRHSFATLVTQQDGMPYASHLQLMLDSSAGTRGVLSGHMARNNAQWRDFAAGVQTLAIFHGPHAYVSPAWYEASPMSAPTWNYMVVHAYGEARILPDEELLETLHRQVDVNERARAEPWKLEISPALKERALGAIVGFEIRLDRLEGKFKLSQNKSEQDRRNVIAQLSRSEDGKTLADWMSRNLEGECK